MAAGVFSVHAVVVLFISLLPVAAAPVNRMGERCQVCHLCANTITPS